MRAAVYVDRLHVENRETSVPSVSDGDLLLRVEACGLCGTDLRKILYGLGNPPQILGHEVAGTVVEVGAHVTDFRCGDRVVAAHHTPCYTCHYCRHGSFSMCRVFKKSRLDPGGFAQFVRIPKEHAALTAFRIPEGLSFFQAIHMEPVACVLRNMKRAKLMKDDVVLIVGLGSVGLLTGQIAKYMQAKVIATDLKTDRQAIAKKLGFDCVLSAQDPSLQQHVRDFSEQRGADLAVLTAGTKELYGDVIQFLRDGGSVSIFAGLEPGANVSYDINEVYERELCLYSSYSASPEDLKEALQLLASKAINIDILNAQSFPLSQLSCAIDAVLNQKVLKAIICPQEGQA